MTPIAPTFYSSSLTPNGCKNSTTKKIAESGDIDPKIPQEPPLSKEEARRRERIGLKNSIQWYKDTHPQCFPKKD